MTVLWWFCCKATSCSWQATVCDRESEAAKSKPVTKYLSDILLFWLQAISTLDVDMTSGRIITPDSWDVDWIWCCCSCLCVSWRTMWMTLETKINYPPPPPLDPHHQHFSISPISSSSVFWYPNALMCSCVYSTVSSAFDHSLITWHIRFILLKRYNSSERSSKSLDIQRRGRRMIRTMLRSKLSI